MFIKAFLAVSFFIIFGGFFVFGGFYSTHFKCNKNFIKTDCAIARKHFFGIYQKFFFINNIKGAKIEIKNRTKHKNATIDFSKKLSKVVIYSDTEKISPLFLSNADDKVKENIVKEINMYLIDKNRIYFDKIFRIKNIFGWVGLPFLIIGLLSLSFPFYIIKSIIYKK